ncbi:MAG: hypothetical protein GY951_01180 [Psychromonas sp.]|nr:hypothetical protein [Psychromonas sp.]
MHQTEFLIVAVIVGAAVLGTVLWRYIRQTSQGELALSTTLVLVGFILISTPLWTSIVVKGSAWEISLLNKRSVNQAENYLSLAEAYAKAVPKAQAEKISPAVSELRGALENVGKEVDEAEKAKRVIEIANKIATITTTVNSAL